MKARTLVPTLIFISSVITVMGSCATTTKTQEEREGIEPEIFFRSVVRGDIAEVNRLIEEGADVNAQGGATLFRASISGHKEIVKLLKEAGAK